jgi:hypothetical protein
MVSEGKIAECNPSVVDWGKDAHRIGEAVRTKPHEAPRSGRSSRERAANDCGDLLWGLGRFLWGIALLSFSLRSHFFALFAL